LPGGGTAEPSCRSLRLTAVAALLPALSRRRRFVLSGAGWYSFTHCPTEMPLVLETCGMAVQAVDKRAAVGGEALPQYMCLQQHASAS